MHVCQFVTCNNLVMGLTFIPFMSAGISIVNKFALLTQILTRPDFDRMVSDQKLDDGTPGYIVREWFKVEHENSSSCHVMLVPLLMEVYKTVHCNSG